MSQRFELFERFSPALRSSSGEDAFVLGTEDGHSLYYVPFEYVNIDARLVLVGITPGPRQMKCAYATARRLLNVPMATTDALREIKKSCAFSGMREKINEMLDHFRIPSCIGVATASALWSSDFGHFHPT